MDVNYGSVSGQIAEYGYTGAFVGGPDLTAPATLTEGDTATITLSGNSAAPTEARLNGAVVALTDAGGGDYTFTVPRLPDDDTAQLQVDVDGYTLPATVEYSNLFPYANTEHGEPNPLSPLYNIALATTDPYEIRIATDTDPAVMTVDWAQIDADGAWLDDITPYITLADGLESGTSSAVLELYRHETGTVESRTVTIEDLGPNGAVTIDSATTTKNAVTIAFSYDRADLDGFEYSIDGGDTWTQTSDLLQITGLTADTEYTVQIRAYNADGPGIITSTTATTQPSTVTTPSDFTFTAQTGVARNITVTSNSITVQGVDAGVDIPISISGDPGSEYSVSTDGGSTWGGWTATPTNVRLNYRVRVRHTSSDEYSSGGYDGDRQTTLNIGGTVGVFQSTTLADTVAPVIQLYGGNQQLVQGETWVDPGYEANDNADGDVTDDVQVDGAIDSDLLGQQEIDYSVTDRSGNTGTATRTVTVIAESNYPMNVRAPDHRTYVCEREFRPGSVLHMYDTEVLDFDFDLADWLADNSDTLSEASVAVTGESLTIIDDGIVSGMERAKVWLSGGTAGAQHEVQVTIKTDSDRTAVFAFLLVVVKSIAA